MPFAHRVGVTACCELLQSKFAHRLQHAEADVAIQCAVLDHEAVVDERRQAIQDARRVVAAPLRYGLGRRQLLGPLLATALVLIQEKFFSFGGYVDKIVLGSLLILVLAFFPQGLMGLLTTRRKQPRAMATTLENSK